MQDLPSPKAMCETEHARCYFKEQHIQVWQRLLNARICDLLLIIRSTIFQRKQEMEAYCRKKKKEREKRKKKLTLS